MLIFFDDHRLPRLYPLTLTRPAAELRIGILTIKEKWARRLGESQSKFLTVSYLREKYDFATESDNLLINGRFLPNDALLAAIADLPKGGLLVREDVIIAAKFTADELYRCASPDGLIWNETLNGLERIGFAGDCVEITRPWDLFGKNDAALREDFALVTKGRTSQPLSSTNQLIGNDIFIEDGAQIECATLNTKTGPIYIGAHAEVMEGSLVRGGLAMLEHSGLKLGTKIYGACTFGPHVKIGGEVNNSVVLGYSNKGHDGFLGNSVLGEWCNLGADTNNSNLKNNYAEVKMWDYETRRFTNTGLQFCGLIMGDHSKAGINTMFNTGTVVGVSSNIFGSGFPRNYIPSFAWGGAQGITSFALPKAYEVAERMMERRKIPFTDADRNILKRAMEIDGFE
jgi:UDP-N-acetylglucosamine diphosphorylase/glucosamine-1-phosphate N-acetyltransferase